MATSGREIHPTSVQKKFKYNRTKIKKETSDVNEPKGSNLLDNPIKESDSDKSCFQLVKEFPDISSSDKSGNIYYKFNGFEKSQNKLDRFPFKYGSKEARNQTFVNKSNSSNEKILQKMSDSKRKQTSQKKPMMHSNEELTNLKIYKIGSSVTKTNSETVIEQDKVSLSTCLQYDTNSQNKMNNIIHQFQPLKRRSVLSEEIVHRKKNPSNIREFSSFESISSLSLETEANNNKTLQKWNTPSRGAMDVYNSNPKIKHHSNDSAKMDLSTPNTTCDANNINEGNLKSILKKSMDRESNHSINKRVRFNLNQGRNYYVDEKLTPKETNENTNTFHRNSLWNKNSRFSNEVYLSDPSCGKEYLNLRCIDKKECKLVYDENKTEYDSDDLNVYPKEDYKSQIVHTESFFKRLFTKPNFSQENIEVEKQNMLSNELQEISDSEETMEIVDKERTGIVRSSTINKSLSTINKSLSTINKKSNSKVFGKKKKKDWTAKNIKRATKKIITTDSMTSMENEDQYSIIIENLASSSKNNLETFLHNLSSAISLNRIRTQSKLSLNSELSVNGDFNNSETKILDQIKSTLHRVKSSTESSVSEFSEDERQTMYSKKNICSIEQVDKPAKKNQFLGKLRSSISEVTTVTDPSTVFAVNTVHDRLEDDNSKPPSEGNMNIDSCSKNVKDAVYNTESLFKLEVLLEELNEKLDKVKSLENYKSEKLLKTVENDNTLDSNLTLQGEDVSKIENTKELAIQTENDFIRQVNTENSTEAGRKPEVANNKVGIVIYANPNSQLYIKINDDKTEKNGAMVKVTENIEVGSQEPIRKELTHHQQQTNSIEENMSPMEIIFDEETNEPILRTNLTKYRIFQNIKTPSIQEGRVKSILSQIAESMNSSKLHSSPKMYESPHEVKNESMRHPQSTQNEFTRAFQKPVLNILQSVFKYIPRVKRTDKNKETQDNPNSFKFRTKSAQDEKDRSKLYSFIFPFCKPWNVTHSEYNLSVEIQTQTEADKVCSEHIITETDDNNFVLDSNTSWPDVPCTLYPNGTLHFGPVSRMPEPTELKNLSRSCFSTVHEFNKYVFKNSHMIETSLNASGVQKHTELKAAYEQVSLEGQSHQYRNLKKV